MSDPVEFDEVTLGDTVRKRLDGVPQDVWAVFARQEYEMVAFSP